MSLKFKFSCQALHHLERHFYAFYEEMGKSANLTRFKS